jgi:MFS family permease
MPRAVTGYRFLLRTPGAAAFFLAAAVGRTGTAMTGLGLVWLLHARTGSYGTAGLAVAGFALAEAMIGPQLARLIDRFGQTRILPCCLLAHGAAIVVADRRRDLRRCRRSPARCPLRGPLGASAAWRAS